MALVITIDNKYELKRRFEAANRDYYSLDACEALIELFDELEGNVELDIVGICGDYNEEDPEYILDNYGYLDEFEGVKDKDGEIDIDALMEALNYYTYAVLLDNGNILYGAF